MWLNPFIISRQAFSTQPAQQLRAVSTGILPSKVTAMETKTLNHRGRREAQRKNLFCRRFALLNADFKNKTKN
jgi:hypothetical protein